MAKKIIKNMNDLASILEPKIKETLKLVAEDVKKEIDETLRKYYNDEFEVTSYERTFQLLDCCTIGTVKKDGNKINIEVYLDIDSLDYETKGADPYKTVVAANAGLHGGWDGYQIPWYKIKSNDGTRHGSNTQIWEEPMHELFDNGKLVELFKKYAKARGINIK